MKINKLIILFLFTFLSIYMIGCNKVNTITLKYYINTKSNEEVNKLTKNKPAWEIDYAQVDSCYKLEYEHKFNATITSFQDELIQKVYNDDIKKHINLTKYTLNKSLDKKEQINLKYRYSWYFDFKEFSVKYMNNEKQYEYGQSLKLEPNKFFIDKITRQVFSDEIKIDSNLDLLEVINIIPFNKIKANYKKACSLIKDIHPEENPKNKENYPLNYKVIKKPLYDNFLKLLDKVIIELCTKNYNEITFNNLLNDLGIAIENFKEHIIVRTK